MGHSTVIETFNDRLSFEGSITYWKSESFNSYKEEISFHNSTLDVGDFSLSIQGDLVSDRNFIDLPEFQFPIFDIDGTPVVNVFTYEGSSLFIAFEFPIFAFGADFSNINGGIDTDIVLNGVYLNMPRVPDFFGFKSGTAFSEIEVRSRDTDGFSFDNATYAPIEVNTPITAYLFIILCIPVIFNKSRILLHQ